LTPAHRRQRDRALDERGRYAGRRRRGWQRRRRYVGTAPDAGSDVGRISTPCAMAESTTAGSAFCCNRRDW
jgi:hypothetical protein